MKNYAGLRDGRRSDFDWLRIIALGLLIITHVTYVYRTVGWRINSEHTGLWANLLVEAMAPWRISLVFFIGGAATRFMLESNDLGGFVRNRMLRLGVPFLMALLLLVPPMAYVSEPWSRGPGGYLGFLALTAWHEQHVYGVPIPDLGHVWFLPYLLLYAMLAGLAFRYAPKTFAAASRAVANAPVFLIVGLLAIFFVVADAILTPMFGRSNILVDDPASHVRCIPPFLLGLALARAPEFWTRLKRNGPMLLAGAMTMLPVVLYLATKEAQPGAASVHGFLKLVGLGDGIYGAIVLFTILAFASMGLNRKSAGLKYFGEAIMPVYLMHQPVIVAMAVALYGVHMPLWAEYPLMLAAAAGIPLAAYHFGVRPFPSIRLLFGLKPHQDGQSMTVTDLSAGSPAHP